MDLKCGKVQRGDCREQGRGSVKPSSGLRRVVVLGGRGAWVWIAGEKNRSIDFAWLRENMSCLQMRAFHLLGFQANCREGTWEA